jgi:hypothetical protein
MEENIGQGKTMQLAMREYNERCGSGFRTSF